MSHPPKTRKRLFRLCLAGLVLCLCAASLVEFNLRYPRGSGPAGQPVLSEPFDETWSDTPVLLLGIGDSVTAGLGADVPEHSYFNRLANNPHDEFEDMQGKSLHEVLPNLTVRNLAVSGSNSIQHEVVVNDLLADGLETHFGIVCMTTGGNDLIHFYGNAPPREGAMFGATINQAQPWIENFRHRLMGMLDSIDQKFEGRCEVYLADIYDPTDGAGTSFMLKDWKDGLAIHAAYNQVIRDVCGQRGNVNYVPMHQEFLGHGGRCRQFWRKDYDSSDPHYWYYNNFEDPNDRGYDAIRRLFLNEIIEHCCLRER